MADPLRICYEAVPSPKMIILVGTGVVPSLALLFLPVAILLMAMFTLGVSLFLSAWAAYFADILDIHQIVLSAWMYLTPIIYPEEIIPPNLQFIFYLNPMYYLVKLFRLPLIDGTIPSIELILMAALCGFGALIIGWIFFTSKSDEFAYRI